VPARPRCVQSQHSLPPGSTKHTLPAPFCLTLDTTVTHPQVLSAALMLAAKEKIHAAVSRTLRARARLALAA
jgi:hypothetical protein